MLRIQHYLGTRVIDGGKILSVTCSLRSTLQTHYFTASGTHLYYRLNKLQGLVRLEGLGKLKQLFYLIGLRTHDVSVCSIVPQPTRYSDSQEILCIS
jgi:hypothetical protein